MKPDKLSYEDIMIEKINRRARQIKYYNGLNPMYSTRRRSKFKSNRSSHFKK